MAETIQAMIERIEATVKAQPVIDSDYEYRIFKSSLTTRESEYINVQGEGYLDAAFLYTPNTLSNPVNIQIVIDDIGLINWNVPVNYGVSRGVGIAQAGNLLMVPSGSSGVLYLDGLYFDAAYTLYNHQFLETLSPMGSGASKAIDINKGALVLMNSPIHFRKSLIIKADCPRSSIGQIYSKYWLKVRGL